MKLLMAVMLFAIASALVSDSAGLPVSCQEVQMCALTDQEAPDTMTKEDCDQFHVARACYKSSLEDCRSKTYEGKEEDIAKREENMKKLDHVHETKCAAHYDKQCPVSPEQGCNNHGGNSGMAQMSKEDCKALKEDIECMERLTNICSQQNYEGKEDDDAARRRQQQQRQEVYNMKCQHVDSAVSGSTTAVVSVTWLVLCGFIHLMF